MAGYSMAWYDPGYKKIIQYIIVITQFFIFLRIKFEIKLYLFDCFFYFLLLYICLFYLFFIIKN
jgi:hypothetical protein